MSTNLRMVLENAFSLQFSFVLVLLVVSAIYFKLELYLLQFFNIILYTIGPSKRKFVSKKHRRLLVNRELEKELSKARYSIGTNIVPYNSASKPLSEAVDIKCDFRGYKTNSEIIQYPSACATTCPSYCSPILAESIQEISYIGDKQFVNSVRGWFLKYRHLLSQSAMNELLLILKPNCKSLPSDCRTFLNTPQTCRFPISCVSPGNYCHFGLEYMLQKLLNCNDRSNLCLNSETSLILSFSINVDGLPLSKSLTSQFWPILISIDYTNLKISNPFPVEGYHGVTKPESALQCLNAVFNVNISTGVSTKSENYKI